MDIPTCRAIGPLVISALLAHSHDLEDLLTVIDGRETAIGSAPYAFRGGPAGSPSSQVSTSK
jgi:hypothetical protein